MNHDDVLDTIKELFTGLEEELCITSTDLLVSIVRFSFRFLGDWISDCAVLILAKNNDALLLNKLLWSIDDMNVLY